MIVTPKENILIYFHLRQKIILLCTHKAHFYRPKKNNDFRLNCLFSPAKLVSLKNFEYTHQAQKKYIERNFIGISKSVLYYQYCKPRGTPKILSILPSWGDCPKWLKNSQKQLKTAKF